MIEPAFVRGEGASKEVGNSTGPGLPRDGPAPHLGGVGFAQVLFEGFEETAWGETIRGVGYRLSEGA